MGAGFHPRWRRDAVTFLGWGQHTVALRFKRGGGAVVCWLGFGAYLWRILISAGLGPGVTYVLLTQTRADEVVPIIVFSVVALLGWVLLLDALLFRQRVVFDFAHQRIVLESRFLLSMFRQEFIPLSEITGLRTWSEVTDEDRLRPRAPLPTDRVRSHVLGMMLGDGGRVRLIETTIYPKIERLCDAIDAESSGRLTVERRAEMPGDHASTLAAGDGR